MLRVPSGDGTGSYGLWVRYGGEPVSGEQMRFAAEHYSVALLQPGEVWAAKRLKELNPRMVVLCYKCLSSTRSYETRGPFTSGVSFAQAREAEKNGDPFFARRKNGELIEWEGYPGHYQMRVWSPAYRRRWVENVTAELVYSPFDGVLADNDHYGDYYGLHLPLRDAPDMATLHRGLDLLVREAGEALNRRGKILVPNIAESRCDPGKWERHSAYGGGFEEVFMGWGANDYLDYVSGLAQVQQMRGDFPPVTLKMADNSAASMRRLTLLRASTDNTNSHPNFLAALAALWVFSGGQWTALSAGGHDMHNGTPWREELAWDLGTPLGDFFEEKGALVRRFSGGWAAVNMTDSSSGRLRVPAGLVSTAGPSPKEMVLGPHTGALMRRS